MLAVPCASLPAVTGELGTRMHDRSAVLVASKGLVPPLGTTPTAYVSERVSNMLNQAPGHGRIAEPTLDQLWVDHLIAVFNHVICHAIFSCKLRRALAR